MMVLQHLRSRLSIVLFGIIAIRILLLGYNYRATACFQNVDFRWADRPVSKVPCACRQCISAEDEDPWFMERFNTTIPLLLTQKNNMLSKWTYKWWKRIKPSANRANYRHVVQTLFQLIPDEEHLMDAGPNRCRTCAVVGNSGNLKGSKYGPLIDSNDFVFRMNKAPTSGYEMDVGIRTTHRVANPGSTPKLQNGTNLLVIPFKTLDLQLITCALTTDPKKCTCSPVMSHINPNKTKVLIYNPTFMKHVSNTWLENHGKYPSTGFLTLMFAIHICDEVNVYGFGAARNGIWHHYWERTKLKPGRGRTGVHAGDYEYNVTKLLASKEKIKMFNGR